MKLSYYLSREHFFEALRFAAVGVLNSVVGLGMFSLLVYVFLINSSAANVISYIVGLTNSYIWNRKWTFRSQGNKRREISLFLLVFAVAYGSQYAAFYLLRTTWSLEPVLAFIGGMFVYTGVGYLGNKLLTFKK